MSLWNTSMIMASTQYQMINKQIHKVDIQEDLQIITFLLYSWEHKWRNKAKNKDRGQHMTFFIDGSQDGACGVRSTSKWFC